MKDKITKLEAEKLCKEQGFTFEMFSRKCLRSCQILKLILLLLSKKDNTLSKY